MLNHNSCPFLIFRLPNGRLCGELAIHNNKDYISVGVFEDYIVASELKDPIWHSLEWQIGSFSSEATIYTQAIFRIKQWLIFTKSSANPVFV